MRLAAQAKGGFYPTPERVVDLLAGLIHTPTGYYHRDRETLRILDPCCGAGEALAQLAGRMDAPNAIPIETYGVELHRDRAEEAGEAARPRPGHCCTFAHELLVDHQPHSSRLRGIHSWNIAPDITLDVDSINKNRVGMRYYRGQTPRHAAAMSTLLRLFAGVTRCTV